MKKKVLFLIHDLGQGGAEKVLVNLVNNLNHEQFDITVMTLFGGGINEKFLSGRIRYLTVYKKAIPGNSHLMKLLSPISLHRKYIKEKYDIEISFLEGPAARVISGCRNPDTKLLCWIHGQKHTRRNAAWSFRSYSESEKCYKSFDRIITVSQDVKKDFISIYPHVFDPVVLYNTNESERILELAREKTDAFEDTCNEIKIVGVGKLTGIKGFDRLARIHKRLIEEKYPVHTYVLGEGTERELLESYLGDNNLSDSFTLVGYQLNPYKYVAKCDLFVCSSYSEGFSTAATEALIVGTPVCTVDVSGMKEMLGEHNEYGVVTENTEEALYQGIKSLLDDPDLLAHYKKQAAERGKMFSKEKTVRAVEEMLLSI